MKLNIIFTETPRNILSSKPAILESRLNNTEILKINCSNRQFTARKYDILIE